MFNIPLGTYIIVPPIITTSIDTKTRLMERIIKQYAIAYAFCGNKTEAKIKIAKQLNLHVCKRLYRIESLNVKKIYRRKIRS